MYRHLLFSVAHLLQSTPHVEGEFLVATNILSMQPCRVQLCVSLFFIVQASTAGVILYLDLLFFVKPCTCREGTPRTMYFIFFERGGLSVGNHPGLVRLRIGLLYVTIDIDNSCRALVS